MHPDDLTGEQLRQAAAIADGAVDVDAFDPWALFLRVADVMERWGPVYVVHVRMSEQIGGLTNWVAGRGGDPLEACLRAFLKSRRSRIPAPPFR